MLAAAPTDSPRPLASLDSGTRRPSTRRRSTRRRRRRSDATPATTNTTSTTATTTSRVSPHIPPAGGGSDPAGEGDRRHDRGALPRGEGARRPHAGARCYRSRPPFPYTRASPLISHLPPCRARCAALPSHTSRRPPFPYLAPPPLSISHRLPSSCHAAHVGDERQPRVRPQLAHRHHGGRCGPRAALGVEPVRDGTRLEQGASHARSPIVAHLPLLPLLRYATQTFSANVMWRLWQVTRCSHCHPHRLLHLTASSTTATSTSPRPSLPPSASPLLPPSPYSCSSSRRAAATRARRTSSVWCSRTCAGCGRRRSRTRRRAPPRSSSRRGSNGCRRKRMRRRCRAEGKWNEGNGREGGRRLALVCRARPTDLL